MSPSPIEAYDLIRHATLLAERLAAAQVELEKKRGLKVEREWLRAAVEVLGAAREPAPGIVERARGLPGLVEVRDELGVVFQGLWVDALERLLAGITFHAGPRAPLIEAIFPHAKLAALRKASRESALGFADDLGRRMKTSYVTRTLAEPTFAFALPVLDQLASAFAQWQEVYSGESMPEPRAGEVLKELLAAAKRLELACRQAKLLAEAALAPCGGLFDELGLSAKPKRRGARSKEQQPSVAGGEEHPASAGGEEQPPSPPTESSPAPEPPPGKAKRKKRSGA
jgi:hypothetical protein